MPNGLVTQFRGRPKGPTRPAALSPASSISVGTGQVSDTPAKRGKARSGGDTPAEERVSKRKRSSQLPVASPAPVETKSSQSSFSRKVIVSAGQSSLAHPSASGGVVSTYPAICRALPTLWTPLPPRYLLLWTHALLVAADHMRLAAAQLRVAAPPSL